MVFQCGEDVDVEEIDISWSSKRMVVEFCQANRHGHGNVGMDFGPVLNIIQGSKNMIM